MDTKNDDELSVEGEMDRLEKMMQPPTPPIEKYQRSVIILPPPPKDE